MASVEAARAGARSRFGVGIQPDIVTASVLAVLNSALRPGLTAKDLPQRPSSTAQGPDRPPCGGTWTGRRRGHLRPGALQGA